MNVGVENADTYRKNIVNNSVVVAPSISFLPKEGTRFNADLVYVKGKTNFDRGRPIVRGGKDVLALPMDLTVVMPNDHEDYETFNLTLSYSQRITEKLNLNVSYLKAKATDYSDQHDIYDYITNDSLSLAYGIQRSKTYGNNLSAYFTYKANTGKVEHTILGGYDFINGGYTQYYKTAATMQDGVTNFSLIHPAYAMQPVESYKYRPENINNYGEAYYTNGIYIQDLLKYNRLKVLLSLRQEFYSYPKADDASIQGLMKERQSQKALLPRIGITYGVTDNINVYATYNTGFEAQDSYAISNPKSGGPFPPLKSNLLEAGAKGEFFNKKLFAGMAVYQIIQNNVLVSANDMKNPDLMKVRGQERARGIELEAGGYVFPNLSVQLSYAYNNAIITKSSEGDPDHQIGLSKEGAPKNISGSWIKYSVRNGDMKGLGIGIGHSQVSKKVTYDRDLEIPASFILNGAVYYNIDKFSLSANFNNIANKKYLVGGFGYDRTFPGAPRNYVVGVGYTF